MMPGVECNCLTCGKVFAKTARGMKKKYCSTLCRKKASAEKMKSRTRAKVTAICLRCGVSFQCRSDARGMYCSKTCSNIANGAKVDRDAIRKRLTGNKNCTGKNRPDAALRMRERNPMSNEATREKMKKSLSGRTFLSRGGNGQLTKPQKKLFDKLMEYGFSYLYTEYPISTKPVTGMFPSLPPSYKVDIGFPKVKIAIEVDGNSHKSKKWKFLDKRKTEIISSMGWRVLRFTNEDVMSNTDAVVKRIHSFMI